MAKYGTLLDVVGKRKPYLRRRPADRRARRAGVVALFLLMGSVSLALLAANHYHRSVADASIATLIGGGTLSGVYLAWLTYRDSQASGEALTLAAVADELAAAIGSQWEREAVARRLNDPYPLPIRWAPADAAVSDRWDGLVALASSGAGWPAPVTTWAAGPAELAGGGNQLAEVLSRVPTGRLVILGEPGSGKTMLMLRLVLDLLQGRSPGDVVPVLVSAASWDPKIQDYHSWLSDQLLIAYPALGASFSQGDLEVSRVDALLRARLIMPLLDGFDIMPLLDGFDELPEGVRTQTIAEIKDQLRPGEPIVLTSRTAEYQAATHPATGPEIALAAAAVELRPLEAADVIAYLRESAEGSRSASRWDNVFTELAYQQPLAEVLSNPLMLGLARIIYNPRPGELTAALPDPAELCGLSGKESIEGHLLDAFISAAYRPDRERDRLHRGWNAQQAERWLTFFAHHLEHVIRKPGIAWWDLNASSLTTTNVASGVTAGLAVGAPLILVPVLFVLAGAALSTHRTQLPSVYADFLLTFDNYWKLITRIILSCGIAGAIAALLITASRWHKIGRRWPEDRKWHDRGVTIRKVPLGFIYYAGYLLIIFNSLHFAFGWSNRDAFVGAGEAVSILAVIFTARSPSGEQLRAAALVVFAIGVMAGAPFTLYKYNSGAALTVGLTVGLAAGLIALASRHDRYPSQAIRWKPQSGLATGITIGAAAGFLTALVARQLIIALTFSIAVGIGTMVIAGLRNVPDDLGTAASPMTVLKRDRAASLTLAVVTALAAGLAVGIGTFLESGTELLPDLSPLLDGLVFGIALGPAVGFTFAFSLSGYGSAWPRWVFAREVLAIRRCVPWRLMTFLSDAHQCGILRQVGPVYEFRHIELQRRLASRIARKETSLEPEEPTPRQRDAEPVIPPRPIGLRKSPSTRGIRNGRLILTAISVFVAGTASIFVYDNLITIRPGNTAEQVSSVLPVIACPTVYGAPGPRRTGYPATMAAAVPRDLGARLAYYTDKARSVQPIIGPRGWACSATVAVDGGVSIAIYPPGGSPDGPVEVDARNDSACQGCIYSQACQLVPDVAAQIHYFGIPCDATSPPRQAVTSIKESASLSVSGNDVIGIVDPPGIKGFVTPSGGRYYARGVLLYSWGQPPYIWILSGGFSSDNVSVISCTLPNADFKLCSTILAIFRQQTWS